MGHAEVLWERKPAVLHLKELGTTTTPEFFRHRLQTSMTRAAVEDSTAGLGQNPPYGTSSGWWVILPWHLRAVHDFTGTQAAWRVRA